MASSQKSDLPSHSNGKPSEDSKKDAGTTAATPRFGAYQNEIYFKGLMHNIMPVVTNDPNKLEAQARSKMSVKAYNYVAGGAGERSTMDANRLAFRTWKLIPRMLRPPPGDRPSQRTTLFGKEYSSPIIMAPVGVQSIFHPCGEKGMAKVATKVGIPYTMSTASSASIEDVAAASGSGDRWFQLYWPKTHAYTVSMLSRAKAAGFTVLLVTLDTYSMAWRPWDLDETYLPFAMGMGNQVGFSDPVFRKAFHEGTGKTPEEDLTGASMAWTTDVFPGLSHSWDDVQLVLDNWDGPVVLKGIQHPEDAKKAAHMGVAGIVVSNHGGRQMDGAVASLEMLPEIVDALAGTKCEVLFDSGVRTGVDIIKALALGAKGVLIGRPWVYGMAIGGEAGAEAVLRGLLADLDQSMGLAGIGSVKELNRGWLRRTHYPGDRHSNY